MFMRTWRLRHRALALLVIQVAAFWPVWRWYALRATDASSESWELLALATAALFVILRTEEAAPKRIPLGLPIFLLLIYAASYAFLPPLLRAALAMSALAATCSAIWFGRRLHLALWSLLLLSLPVIASLNFYLGYPLRVVAGVVTAALLQMNGLAVIREGTLLNWDGQLIAIDAPCSGVKMLWAGLYLCFTLAAFQRQDGRSMALLGMLTVVAIVLSNILRATALFYVETGLVALPKQWHAGIGVVVFLVTALAIASAAHYVKKPTYAT